MCSGNPSSETDSEISESYSDTRYIRIFYEVYSTYSLLVSVSILHCLESLGYEGLKIDAHSLGHDILHVYITVNVHIFVPF